VTSSLENQLRLSGACRSGRKRPFQANSRRVLESKTEPSTPYRVATKNYEKTMYDPTGGRNGDNPKGPAIPRGSKRGKNQCAHRKRAVSCKEADSRLKGRGLIMGRRWIFPVRSEVLPDDATSLKGTNMNKLYRDGRANQSLTGQNDLQRRERSEKKTGKRFSEKPS